MPADEEHLSDERIGGPETTHDIFKSEANRIQSFNEWPEEETGQSGVRLAKAGFFYTGDKTTVQCFECGTRLNQWSSEDIPFEKHRQLYPNCKFVKGLSDNRSLVESTGSTQNVSDDSGHNSCGSSPLSSSPPNNMSTFSGASSDENEEQFPNNNNNNNNNNSNREENMRELRQRMKCENNRLKTFYVNDQCLWPVPGVSPQELARSGFHYLNDDRVQCAFCTGILSNWSPGLRPLGEHAKKFPLCPFIMEEDVGNIPIGIDPMRDPLPVIGHDVCGIGPMPSERLEGSVQRRGGASNSTTHLQKLGVQLYTGPRNPDMGPLEVRKQSFQNSCWDPRVPVSPERLAEAGFYYLGIADGVKCFHCDLGLAQWEEGDDPWVEHAKKADNCNFLKLNKSKEFLDHCKSMEGGPHNQRPESNEDMDDEAVCRVIDEWMATELVQEFVSLNLYSIDLVKMALNRRYYTHKRPFDSFADMYDKVSELAERAPSSRQSDQSNRQTNNQLLDIIEMKPTPPTPQQSTSGQSTSGQSSSSGTTSTSKASETQPKAEVENEATKAVPDMENPLLCKLCYLNEIEVVFLACGHQLACTQCAQRLSDCPVCRQPIQGYVRTFFS